MATLPCPDGGGSINNPAAPPEQTGLDNPDLKPYVPPNICSGELDLVSSNDLCAQNEFQNQQGYVQEVLNISGAPIKVFKLLGVHEQSDNSLLSEGIIIGSASLPGYALSNINSGNGSWQSAQSGSAVVTSSAYVGFDFGFKKLLPSNYPEYAPPKPNLKTVAAISIKQGNTATNYARQVRVDITEGDTIAGAPSFTGIGNGSISITGYGPNASISTISAMAISPTEFLVVATLPNAAPISLGTAVVNQQFTSTYIDFIISAGSIDFEIGDLFTVSLDYEWKRAGVFNLVQSASAAILNLQTGLLVKAIRVTPTLYTGTGNWEVLEFDILESAPTDINNIQDLFFNENRDRDYAKVPLVVRCQYQPSDSISDLSKFGLNILDQYSFTTSFVAMVSTLGRPIVTGDILELPMEMQYDQNLKPIRKFLEVTDTGWSAEGFSPSWRPTVFRFSAQQALPSQETRDIFGTIDTQKYLVEDSILADGMGEQLDTTPLTQSEEIAKAAADAVPSIGSDEQLSVSVPLPAPFPKQNYSPNQPMPMTPKYKASGRIEDGLPPNGEPYLEGYTLPDITNVNDGDYFRLYYPEETKIAPRLYRFSAMKNRWIYLETDRRGDYSSHKPTVRNILESNTKQGLGKKLT